MTHLHEYVDGSDESIFRYIEGDSGWPPYGPETPTLQLEVNDFHDLSALHDIAVDGLNIVRQEFITACQQSLSSYAGMLAHRFKHLTKLRLDVVKLAAELHGDAWVQERGW